jgi:hypothetical protein
MHLILSVPFTQKINALKNELPTHSTVQTFVNYVYYNI